MYDRPDLTEQLEAVAKFLREGALPQLTGHTAFNARVAANLLDIAGRQMMLGPAAQASELARLRVLLQREGDLEALNRELCERIADGRIGPQSPQLLEHLWKVTLDKLAVDQPRYETYQRMKDNFNPGT
jgi:hypothetical protein